MCTYTHSWKKKEQQTWRTPAWAYWKTCGSTLLDTTDCLQAEWTEMAVVWNERFVTTSNFWQQARRWGLQSHIQALSRQKKKILSLSLSLSLSTKYKLHILRDLIRFYMVWLFCVQQDWRQISIVIITAALDDVIIITMYIYHALINALSAHMIHINLNTIFCTHVEHTATKTIYIRYYMETYNTHTHTHTHTDCSRNWVLILVGA